MVLDKPVGYQVDDVEALATHRFDSNRRMLPVVVGLRWPVLAQGEPIGDWPAPATDYGRAVPSLGLGPREPTPSPASHARVRIRLARSGLLGPTAAPTGAGRVVRFGRRCAAPSPGSLAIFRPHPEDAGG